MALIKAQVAHAGLWNVYNGGSSASINTSDEGRCCRLMDAIDKAVKPDDLNIAGMGYKFHAGVYSVDVNGVGRITYLWNAGKGDAIDYR